MPSNAEESCHGAHMIHSRGNKYALAMTIMAIYTWHGMVVAMAMLFSQTDHFEKLAVGEMEHCNAWRLRYMSKPCNIPRGMELIFVRIGVNVGSVGRNFSCLAPAEDESVASYENPGSDTHNLQENSQQNVQIQQQQQSIENNIHALQNNQQNHGNFRPNEQNLAENAQSQQLQPGIPQSQQAVQQNVQQSLQIQQLQQNVPQNQQSFQQNLQIQHFQQNIQQNMQQNLEGVEQNGNIQLLQQSIHHSHQNVQQNIHQNMQILHLQQNIQQNGMRNMHNQQNASQHSLEHQVLPMAALSSPQQHQQRSNGAVSHENGGPGTENIEAPRGLQNGFNRDMRELEDLLSKLNPMAKEFVPPSLANHASAVSLANVLMINNNNNRRKKNNCNQGKRRVNSRTSIAQREDSIRRTVYVSDIDQQVVDCRVCGDPNSVLRFAFVEFTDEEGAKAALSLAGTMLGYYPVRVLPSKTAIAPVNPTFLPRVLIIDIILQSEDEREMCARTIYCTNIDKKVKYKSITVVAYWLVNQLYVI
eukprot:Gb_06522 [translate_table: standard]